MTPGVTDLPRYKTYTLEVSIDGEVERTKANFYEINCSGLLRLATNTNTDYTHFKHSCDRILKLV